MIKNLVNDIKFRTWYYSEPILRKLVLKKKGVGARLCQAKLMPKRPDFAGMKIAYNGTTIPLNKPLFYDSGKVEDEYVSRLNSIKQSATNITEPCGVISASNVDVSFPNSIHHWRGRIFEEAIPNSILIFSNPKYVLSSESIPFYIKKRMPEAIMLSMPLYHNFYHWLIEILPRLAILENLKEDLSSLPLVMPKQHPQFVKDSLSIAGLIDRTSFIDNGVVKFEQLHLLTKISPQNSASPIAVEWLRKKFLKDTDRNLPKRRIYVSRRDANSRCVTNESDVEKLLLNYGFEILCMSDYSLEKQIEIFQDAEMIVGSHGAAFANLVFTPAKSVFIELFSPYHLNHCFYHIAGIRNLKYGFLVCKADGHGIFVDIKNLQKMIEQTIQYL